ncbi:hypothetical protein PIB30_006941 [Stylosanthes scabra]|uniref:Uncharacterized protein n=1 Tax=Stylosanthes scabra TaxID=79078 RepID=A0ABU6Y4G9_9FABA|nr:hypothetical protein [Stylosanthes scabra]
MIEAMARGWVKMLNEDLIQKDEEEELEESCCAEQKSQKKGPDKTYEKPSAEYPSVTRMLDEIEQILYHNKGADAHLVRNNSKWKYQHVQLKDVKQKCWMAPRKVYPPPSRFSRRLVAMRARQAKDEAANENAAPHNNEVVNISSDLDSEQVPKYVPREEK